MRTYSMENNQGCDIQSMVKDTQAHFEKIYLIFFCDALDEHSNSEGIIGCFQQDT